MIRSMTGFGAAHAEDQNGRYSIEIRSVNNKFFKAMMRLPDELAALEPELESMISRRLRRGSITLTGRFIPGGDNLAGRIDVDAARAATQQLMEALPEDLRAKATIDLGSLLAAPGVIKADVVDVVLDQARGMFESLVTKACDDLIFMRNREGEAVHGELVEFGQLMAEHVKAIAERAPLVVDAFQKRLHSRIESLLAEVGSSVEESDLIREVAIFAERSDVAEELARLDGHLLQYTDLLATQDGSPVGRTLDFLTQEMLREANTIASKSADVDISRRIVEVKGLIDRIKEQAQNVE